MADAVKEDVAWYRAYYDHCGISWSIEDIIVAPDTCERCEREIEPSDYELVDINELLDEEEGDKQGDFDDMRNLWEIHGFKGEW